MALKNLQTLFQDTIDNKFYRYKSDGTGLEEVSLTGSGGTVTAVTGITPITVTSGNTPEVSIQPATESQSGYITSEHYKVIQRELGFIELNNHGGSGEINEVIDWSLYSKGLVGIAENNTLNISFINLDSVNGVFQLVMYVNKNITDINNELKTCFSDWLFNGSLSLWTNVLTFSYINGYKQINIAQYI